MILLNVSLIEQKAEFITKLEGVEIKSLFPFVHN